MAYAIKDFQQTIGSGLGTWTYTTSIESVFRVSCFSTFNSPSGLIITINHNGSPVGPTPTSAPGSTQGEINVEVLINCQSGDVITVVISSSQPTDVLSAKNIINLHQGN